MEFYLHKGKITADQDFNLRDEWLNFPVRLKTILWFAHGEIPFFGEHIRQANLCFEYLQRPYHIDSDDSNEILRLSKRLINKNKAYMAGWLHLNWFLNDKNRVYTMTVEKYPQREFPLDEQGKLAVISEAVKYSKSKAGKSALLMRESWENEKLKIAGTRYGDAIFLNEKGAVVETIGSNLYCISGTRMLTPGRETGCFEDTLRHIVLQSSAGLGLEVIESESITPADLQKADELFTVSEQGGFKWIMGIGFKRYVRKHVEAIKEGVERLIWQGRH